MKIGDEIMVRGFVDEIRQDTVIIRNAGGYFGTAPSEVMPAVVRCRDCRRWTDGDGVNGICRWNDCITRQTLKDAGCTYGERREKR